MSFLFVRPIDDKATDQKRDAPPLTCVRYAVCSGPRQFNAYLKGAVLYTYNVNIIIA